MKVILGDNDLLKVLQAAGVLDEFKAKAAAALMNVADADAIDAAARALVQKAVKEEISKATRSSFYERDNGWAIQELRQAMREAIKGIEVQPTLRQIVKEEFGAAFKAWTEQNVDGQVKEQLERWAPEVMRRAGEQVDRLLPAMAEKTVRNVLSKFITQ